MPGREIAIVVGAIALAILRERYARGEITRAQYEQIRHDLGGP